MCAAAFIALKRDMISEDIFNKIVKITDKYGFDTKICYDDEKIFGFMVNDKKSVGGKLKFVLPTKIGEVVITDDVSNEEISSALEFLRRKETEV